MTENEREEILKKAKPIFFTTEMVRAILDGRKTVTRRAIKPQPLVKIAYCFACSAGSGIGKWMYPGDIVCESWGDESYRLPSSISHNERDRKWTPPCNTDDILYVRETWGTYSVCEGIMPTIYYKADGNAPDKIKWKPSIHMPKEAARIFLKVTNVRVERLQDITVSEAIKEGTPDVWFNLAHKMKLKDTLDGVDLPNSNFIKTWDKTIKKSDLDKYGWNANPWVWVIEFERVDQIWLNDGRKKN